MKPDLIPFSTLTTERLLLRPLRTEDANEIFLLRSDDIVNRYLDRPKANSLKDAEEFIQKIERAVSQHESAYWGMSLKPGSSLIGTICLWSISKESAKAGIGYELLPSFHGQGYMQEAIAAVIQYGFEHMGFHVIEAVFHPDNLASLKLLEKNNFKLNVNPDEQEKDMMVYTLRKKDDEN